MNANSSLSFFISIQNQTLNVCDSRAHKTVASFPISTSKFGEGQIEGSNCTPLGKFSIAAKIGDNAPRGEVFKGRVSVGNFHTQPECFDNSQDLILTRILWLQGEEPDNQNTYARYIYIHGTNQEHLLGTKASYGCIRVAEDDLLYLYDIAQIGTMVVIR